MALLKSVDNVPGLDFHEYRDQQFYGKYEYRLRITIPGARHTRWCKTPEDLDEKLISRSRYTRIGKEDKQMVIDNLPALKDVIELQNTRKSNNLGLRVEHNTIAVFSNDLGELKKIGTNIGAGYHTDYTQAQTTEYAGIKYFVNEPTHKYRVYLKSKRVEEHFYKEMSDLFNRMTELYPSAALLRWMVQKNTWYARWTSASHFIDYDDESTLSYLAIMHGDLLGKKYKLEKRPVIV
jgi:hypothetical protein